MPVLRTELAPGRAILPDYALPDAVCVPFWAFDIAETLEAIAKAAAQVVGVILIGPDPAFARSFIERQPDPERFGFVAGIFDTPWLRDHAPLTVRDGSRLSRVLPRRPEDDRAHDRALFGAILAEPPSLTPVQIAGGNLVSGPDGRAVSTTALPVENGISDMKELRGTAADLGIGEWLFIPPYPDDPSGHTDSMLRFLAPDLCALAVREDHPGAAAVSRQVREELEDLLPDVRVVEVPTRAVGDSFCSPLNWIQLDRTVLLPDYGDADAGSGAVRERLADSGYDVILVPSPTVGLGGALHCLTATIFVD